MSQMVGYVVEPNGEVHESHEWQNGWLGAALVWSKLSDKYFGRLEFPASYERTQRLSAVFGSDPRASRRPDNFGWHLAWALQHDPNLPQHEYDVLITSFDHCVIPREQFQRAAQSMRAFNAEHGGHWGDVAEWILAQEATENIGVCFVGTSVCGDMWCVRPEDEDAEWPRYNINTGDRHFVFNPSDRAERVADGAEYLARLRNLIGPDAISRAPKPVSA